MINSSDEQLADSEVIEVLRELQPPQIQDAESVESILDYGITAAKSERDKILANIINNKILLNNIKILSKLDVGIKAFVDAGNNIFLPARTQDRHILIHIGYQFYVDMEIEEARNFIEKRIQLMQQNLKTLNTKVAEQRAQSFIIAETLYSMSNVGFYKDN
ncbi:Prefoldin subunit family protein [Babesia bovis T2Bo]|uniref:Prefoldin subunit family protein n=1 Tax=Babesia bovis T2Bo TaxID=484906 RepID=UPI001C34AF5B|nr:Prefoldin subunit family protein [Babesia bovis T2Bo]KAG6440174.1 Prefoldin subunit family protein [Babesia bovis T2Bo]